MPTIKPGTKRLFIGMSDGELCRFASDQVKAVRMVEADYYSKDPHDCEIDHINGQTYWLTEVMVVEGNIEAVYSMNEERVKDLTFDQAVLEEN